MIRLRFHPAGPPHSLSLYFNISVLIAFLLPTFQSKYLLAFHCILIYFICATDDPEKICLLHTLLDTTGTFGLNYSDSGVREDIHIHAEEKRVQAGLGGRII